MKLALFDLDGTLLPHDSDHAFGEFLIRLGLADGAEHRRRNDEFFQQYQAGSLDIDAYVEFCTAPWRDLPAEQLAELQRRFIDEVIEPELHPAALTLVRRHQDAGDKVAIVTATNDFVTRPVADLFGVRTLIATELARHADGRPDGRIRGVPSFRDGKITRVRDWLAGEGATLDSFDESWFYSDSTNDLPLLEVVSHPVATNPGPALRAIARQRGWPIVDLFT